MLTTVTLSRSRLVRLGLGGGAALVGLAAADSALAAEPTEGDLATVRLLASGELLAQAFYTRALLSRRISKPEATDLSDRLDHERDHYSALAKTLGSTAPVADDFEFAFPEGRVHAPRPDAPGRRGDRDRARRAVRQRRHDGEHARAPTLLAQAAISEGQHVAALNRMRGAAPAPSFPELLDVEQASAALGPFFGD